MSGEMSLDTHLSLMSSMENLNRDQRDTVYKACALEPCIQILQITKRKSCTLYETIEIMSIFHLYMTIMKYLNFNEISKILNSVIFLHIRSLTVVIFRWATPL